MAIEIVDFPMKNGDFPWQNVSSPEGTQKTSENHGSFNVVSSRENDENDVDNHFSHHKMTIFDSEGVYFSDPYSSAEGRPRMG